MPVLYYTQITANCLHPGVVKTELGRYMITPSNSWYMVRKDFDKGVSHNYVVMSASAFKEREIWLHVVC